MSKIRLKNLPQGWKLIPLGTFRGETAKSINPAELPDEIFELYSVPSFAEGKPEIIPGQEIGSSKRLIKPNTVLLSKINPRINRVWIVGPKKKHTQISSPEWIEFFPSKAVDPKYLMYFMQNQSFREHLCMNVSGVGGSLTRIRPKIAEDYEIPLAPIEQQKRIVAKIEELFSHIDAGIAALQKAKQLLNQYRQSVLKAAVTGELTKEWREANKDKLEPASQLLERILKERRQKWEEQQLEQFKAKGKMPKDDKWKEKYKSSCEYDIDYADQFLSGKDLPDSWALCSLDLLSKLITDGDHNPPKRVDSGIPHLTARNIINGKLDFDNCTHLTEEGFEQTKKRYEPHPGDILITCVGTIGRIAIVPKNVIFSADRNLAASRLNKICVIPEYIEMILNSPDIQQLMLAGSGSTAQPHLYLKQIRSIPVSCPSVIEQNEIVEITEEILDSIDRLTKELEAKFVKAEKTKRSILATSFSGAF